MGGEVKTTQSYNINHGMTSSVAEQAKAFVEKVNAAGDIFTGDDGYYYYWPAGGGGLSAWNLQVLADHLNLINTEWDKEVRQYREGETLDG